MKHKSFVVLVLVLLGSFFIRLIALNQSLWLDEGITARVVREFGLVDIVTKFSPFDFHPPLYYWVLRLWSLLFGSSEVALRMPSVIASLITGVFIYKLVRKSKSLKVDNQALWAMAFFLFNPLIIYYSQEARMYMMATMFVTGGLYFITKLHVSGLTSDGLKDSIFNIQYSIFVGIFLSLAFATFYGSILIIIPLLGYLLFKKKYQALSVVCCLLSVAILVLSPLLYQQLPNAHSSLSVVANWKSVLGMASLKNLVLIFIKFTSGRISFEPKILYYVIAGLWSLVVWSLVILGGWKNKIFLILVICTLSLGIVFSFITPLLQYFRFLFLLPLVAILLALGVQRTLIRVFILSGFITWSLLYLFFPAFHREDWKSLSALIPVNQKVYAIPSSMDALYYYRQDLVLKTKDLRNINQLANSLTRNSLTVIPYTSEIYGFDYQKVLSTIGYTQTNLQSVRGLTVETWSKQ